MLLARGNLLVPAAMLGWIPIVLTLFMVLPARRAILISFLGGILFLPMAGYDLPGIPPYDKATATTYVLLFAICAFDPKKLGTFRPSAIDIPILIWCLVPIPTSIYNGLGVYDGISTSVRQTLNYGGPYLIGRIYFSDREGLKDLVVGIFVAGLVYLPFCLWELRMSPRLHLIVYGFRQHELSQHARGDGWRPLVFMQHGLAVSMFMGIATICGMALLQAKVLTRQFGLSLRLWVPILFVTTVLTKSLFATLLLFVGMAALVLTPRIRVRILVLGLALFPIVYMVTRTFKLWSAEELLGIASLVGSEDRVNSFNTRLTSNDFMLEKAKKHLLLGWGGHGRADVEGDEKGGRILTDEIVEFDSGYSYKKVNVIPETFWTIAFTKYGLIGLLSVSIAFLLPVLALFLRFPATAWAGAATAPVLTAALLVLLHLCDGLMNYMYTPIFSLALGAITGFLAAHRQTANGAAPTVRPAAGTGAVR